MKIALTAIKSFFVFIVACSIWTAVSAAQVPDGTEAGSDIPSLYAPAAPTAHVPDFTCKSAAGDPSLVEVRYTSANGLLYVAVSKPPGSSARIPVPGYMTVNTADLTSTGFVLTATRPLKDTAVIQAAAIPTAYGPYTVTGHFDLKINVYQRWIRDVNISDCSGYPQK